MTRKLVGALMVLLGATLLLEVLLRICGIATAWRNTPDARNIYTHTILCIGDSFVWGPDGRGFPDGMEKRLRSRYGPSSVVVINKGKSGSNSSYILATLPTMLDKYRPDLVIIVTGANNNWNNVREGKSCRNIPWLEEHLRVYRMGKFLLHGGMTMEEHSSRLRPLEDEENSLLAGKRARSSDAHSLRLSALYSDSAHLYCSVKDFGRAGRELDKAIAFSDVPGGEFVRADILNTCLECGFSDKALKLAETQEMKKKNPARVAFTYAMLYQRRGDFARTKMFLERAIRASPEVAEYYYSMGQLYMLDHEKAAGYFRKALRCNPNLPHLHYALGMVYLPINRARAEAEFKLSLRLDPYNSNSLQRLADLYVRQGVPGRFEILRMEIPLLGETEEYHNLLSSLKGKCGTQKNTPQADWENDVASAVTAARNAKAAVIVGSYPEWDLLGMRAAAERNGALYIDFTKIFQRAFKSREEYIAYDKFHCNARGYELMAETFAAEAERLLALKSPDLTPPK